MDKKVHRDRIGSLGIRTRAPFVLPKRSGTFFVVLTLFLLLIRCTWAEPAWQPWPTSDPTWSIAKQKIDRAEKIWKRKSISSYSIRVQVVGFWDRQEYTLVVRDGEVVDVSSTCVPAGPGEPCCTACFEPEDFTVPGLFVVAREKASLSEISFDPEYGFPSTISYNDSRIADEEEEWTVLEFVPENP